MKKAFPWHDPGYRLLRRQIDSTFEVLMASDVYDIVSHHVVFGSIVTPGVVYVEMALEATRKLGDVALKDVTMVFPFVVPNRFEEGPAPTMRFVPKNDTRFEIQSASGGKSTTHVEASLESGVATTKPPLDLEALRARIDEPIDTAVVYDAINSVGLYLGPMFQVAKKLWRKEDSGKSEVLGLLELDFPGVQNVGYVMHPALLDGTIHILATASIGKNVSGLKIFSGVGKVVVSRKENFSKLARYWVHMNITESLEASQTFNVTVAADDGAVLMFMEDVVFRAVKPEQIQMAIAAQGVRDDEQKMYEVAWEPATVDGGDFSGQGLIMADTDEALSQLKKLKTENRTFKKSAEVSDLQGYQWALCVFSSEQRASLLEGLVVALKLLQTLVKSRAQGRCQLVLATRRSQAVKAGDLSGAPCPLHAGLWGLLRSFRNEHPDLPVLCMDLADADWATALCAAPEPELALRDQALAPRLQELTLQDTSAPSLEGGYVVTGGLGGLGLIFASWLVEYKVRVALVSRSGKPPVDCRLAYKRLASKVSVHKADITAADQAARVLKEIREAGPIKGIIHAAGMLDDHMIVDLTPSHLASVLAPKADGTLNLSDAMEKMGEKLDCFALFSSVAALLGTPAQGNYCAANAFMDSFAAHLRDNGGSAVSIQWGPWAEVGMAARANTSEASIARISASKGLEAMQAILSMSSTSSICPVVGVARIKWAALLGQLPAVPPFLSKFSVTKAAAAPVGNYTLEDVKSLVVSSLSDALGTDEFDLSTPLMELGLDSLAGVEFRNRLQAGAGFKNALAKSAQFDWPGCRGRHQPDTDPDV